MGYPWKYPWFMYLGLREEECVGEFVLSLSNQTLLAFIKEARSQVSCSGRLHVKGML
jgi:hypothetical protein